MPLTPLQRDVCRLIAANRIASGESYVAGGAALNHLLGSPRFSGDVDLFHDTDEALAATWPADLRVLEGAGFSVGVLRERPTFVEARASLGTEGVRLQWVRDSAYRFFPLVRHEDLGLTLHPFDLATNKVLALVGRVEVRDWVDVMACHARVQPLGYLAWAACGKDPGFNPRSILEHAARASRYTGAEVAQLEFEGAAPDAGALSREWRAMLALAHEVVAQLPGQQSGTCVLSATGGFCRAPAAELADAMAHNALVFHAGCIRGAWPEVGGV